MPQRDIDRRQQLRVQVSSTALLHVEMLRVPGQVLDVGPGGLFLYSNVLVEAGEAGTLELAGVDPVEVRVAWVRGSTHPLGQGIGMAFEMRHARQERRALELVLALLDDAERHAAANATIE